MKKEYNVTITETLQMTIAVEAENLAEAEVDHSQ
ncbi:MAG: DpnD/PcfM family protein [Oscillospiraceae bacterium]